jgi:hypothetical protein
MNFNFLFPKKKNKIHPGEEHSSSSLLTTRVKTQKKFSRKIKNILEQISISPFQTSHHLQQNDLDIHELYNTHWEQISQMMENQKQIFKMTLQLFQCHLHSSKIQKQKQKQQGESMKKIWKLWDDTTRDLYTHMELIRLQQNDLLELQQEDIMKLELLLSELKCPPLKLQQQQKTPKTMVQQIFGED